MSIIYIRYSRHIYRPYVHQIIDGGYYGSYDYNSSSGGYSSYGYFDDYVGKGEKIEGILRLRSLRGCS